MYANNVSNLDQILSSLQCYVQSARVRGDVYNLLRQIPSLLPNCGTFTHNDGTTSTLLNLEGTIPIFYRGNQYNIPVEIWLVASYPISPPVCFVRPTADMMVKPGHPHVTSDGYVKIPYTSEWRQDYTMVELVAHMCSIFGNMPPVFRRPAHQQVRQPPPPAQPGLYQQAGYAQPPPPVQAQPTPTYQSSSQYQAYSNYPQGGVGTVAAESLFGGTSTVARQEDRSLLLKADITSKIQQELEKMFKRIRDDIDLQFEHQLQLTQSRENVEKGLQSLEFLRDDLVRAKTLIDNQGEEVQAWLDENETQNTVDPDTILVEADPISKQLVKTMAEHQAIEDALYFLDRALSNGEIDLNVFLKEVRKLARKQFMCQALAQKIYTTQQQRTTPTYSISNRS